MEADGSEGVARLTDDDAQTRTHETLLAVRNAATLGASLMLTWSVAIAMRLVLPRYLGPERFGTLSFVDAFSATFFVMLGLGLDLYVRKEVSVRPGHASDFLGGALLLRALLSVLLFLGMAVVLHLTNRTLEVRRLAYVFAFAQFFVVTNQTLSALLHAAGRVAGMSMLSVASKVAWAAGCLAAILLHAGLWAFGASYLLSEAFRTVILCVLARRHLNLTLRFDGRATWRMLADSFPYFVNAVAIAAYGRLDVTLLELRADSREVGWYAAASAIAGLALLAAPIIEWVLTPMFARAAARSTEELFERVRRALEILLAIAIPAALALCLGADAWIRLLFGQAYAPAALALRIRAVMFVLTYVAIVYALTLTMLRRPWALAIVSLVGLATNASLNVAVIAPGIAVLGEGGGGAACALAMVVSEVLVTGVMAVIVGRRGLDRGALATLSASLVACAAVVVLDRTLMAHAAGAARLFVDGATYLAVMALGAASRTREAANVLVTALRPRPGIVDGP